MKAPNQIPFALFVVSLLVCCLAALQCRPAPEPFSLVLQGGRVIDPESGLDAVRHVGLRGDRIAQISPEPLTGAEVIDVGGLVVAPGFIDLHSHSPTPLGQSYQVRDGVTTALDLEGGYFPVTEFGEEIRGRSILNFGSSAGYGRIRARVIQDPDRARAVNTQVAEEQQLPQLRELLLQGLAEGGIGIGLPLDYYSEGIEESELRMIFEVAGDQKALITVHIRRGVNGAPAGLREVLGLAEATGAPLHICHITHNAMRNIELFLSEIREARARGVDVTTEILPYTAGSTSISAAVFGRDWKTIFNIDYGDVEWAATGERFDQAMWEEYREKYPRGAVIHHYLDESWNRRAIVEPGLIVVSDLLRMVTEERKVAPHNGAFSKVLGRFVRQEGLLDLPTAIAKMTLLPARRVQEFAPLFAHKGRLQVGADADITVFDPARVIDRATYQDPYQPSAGIEYVLINGSLVVSRGELQPGIYPGRVLYAGRTRP